MAVDKGNKPLRRLPTLDKDPKRLLKLWQQEGRIPERFTSWEQLDSEFLDLLQSGKTQVEARKELGVTYKNILGSHILEKNESSTGQIRGLNKRAIREDYNVASEQFLRKQYGQDFVTKEKTRLLTDWNKLSEAERVAVQSAFGKQFHRGHGYSALSGGSVSIDNMWPEHGLRNVLHGSSPRWPVEIMRRLNVTNSDLQDAYNKILEREGLGLDLRPDNPQAVAMDEYMVKPVSRTGYVSDPEAGLNPDRAEMLISRQRQLEAQGVSRQAIENYNRNLSGTLSIGSSEAQSPPARTIVEGTPKLKYRVSTEEGARTTTKTLRWNEIPESGSKVLQPNPIVNSYKAANGLTSPTDKPTPSAKPTSKAPPTQATKPAVKPKPTAPKPTSKPRSRLPVSARPTTTTTPSSNKPTAMNPGSASQQIRRLQNSAGDVLRIIPGEWRPSNLPGV